MGTPVLTVRAMDEDVGANANVSYSFSNPTGVNSAFRIDRFSGSLFTREPLDRERVAQYSLQVRAVDNAPIGAKLTGEALVEITILDENDNRPHFSRRTYDVQVSEDIDTADRPVIAEIHATDADEGLNSRVRYSITGGNNDGLFAIDDTNGQLSLLAPIDYETHFRGFKLNVRARDSGSPPASNSTQVNITVIDVNDNDPIFNAESYQPQVREDVVVGHVVVEVIAHDADSGENRRLSFRIVNAPSGMPLRIDEVSGEIQTTDSLDRERDASFAFQVIASDHGVPPRSASCDVTVTVTDVNDNEPRFESSVYEAQVSEEARPGTFVVTVFASDADEDAQLTYAIVAGNTDNAFNIQSQMGGALINVNKELDYERQSRYILTVTAADVDGQLDSATVYINVSDANTYAPVFQNIPYIINVDEDVPIGRAVVTVVAHDDDVGANAHIIYSMDASEVFSIDPDSGDITTKKQLDREQVSLYEVSVTATDRGQPPQSAHTDVEIIVRDVNDNAPEFKAESYHGQVSEEVNVGTSILQVHATDSDDGRNAEVRYTFVGGNDGNGDFRVEATSGIVRTNKRLDRERVAQYSLVALAVDGGAPAQSTRIDVTVDVQDVNDNAPQFETSTLVLYVAENSPIGTTVDTVSASDPDVGVNANVEYEIVAGPDDASFSLAALSGGQGVAVVTEIELDFEGSQNVYEFELRASSDPLFSDVTVQVRVEDRNDNPPDLNDFVIVVNNFRNHFPVAGVGVIPATDPDVNDRLRYSIVSGNSAGFLQLERDTGLLRLDPRLNSDVPSNGSMEVSATGACSRHFASRRASVSRVMAS